MSDNEINNWNSFFKKVFVFLGEEANLKEKKYAVIKKICNDLCSVEKHKESIQVLDSPDDTLTSKLERVGLTSESREIKFQLFGEIWRRWKAATKTLLKNKLKKLLYEVINMILGSLIAALTGLQECLFIEAIREFKDFLFADFKLEEIEREDNQ